MAAPPNLHSLYMGGMHPPGVEGRGQPQGPGASRSLRGAVGLLSQVHPVPRRPLRPSSAGPGNHPRLPKAFQFGKLAAGVTVGTNGGHSHGEPDGNHFGGLVPLDRKIHEQGEDCSNCSARKRPNKEATNAAEKRDAACTFWRTFLSAVLSRWQWGHTVPLMGMDAPQPEHFISRFP